MAAKGLDVERQRDQPLLDAVVQIAFDAPSSLVAGTDDPRPRRDQLRARGLIRNCGRDEFGVLGNADLRAVG